MNSKHSENLLNFRHKATYVIYRGMTLGIGDKGFLGCNCRRRNSPQLIIMIIVHVLFSSIKGFFKTLVCRVKYVCDTV